MSQPQYLVGIDLGTTHTAVAYCKMDKEPAAAIQIFEIPQLIHPGQVAAKTLLPSARYLAAENELEAADLSFSPAGENVIIGQAARELGAKSTGRLVTSAKSWLSHPNIDQHAAILPWGSDAEIDKISPLQASASYLTHVRNVWLHAFPDAPLAEQDVVVTVPASFDEAARALTVEAARQAGLDSIRLLEEPQAVCYDWLHRHADNLRSALNGAKLLLICDIGGGTTDLTLIAVTYDRDTPVFNRIGVGNHLMLGGDNIDLALAHIAEKRLGEQKKLSPAQFSQLIEQCRIAKERLLTDPNLTQANVTLLGSGSRLIGASRTVRLDQEEVRSLALDGFFPLSGLTELPDKKRSGVVEFGLPYASEPAISKHIAAFLQQHRIGAQAALGKESVVPDALLLNGGVFRSRPIVQRVTDLLTAWGDHPPLLLDNAHPELAVAYGACAYALAVRRKTTRIGGGSARSYFLLLGEADPEPQAVCLLAKGTEEGQEQRLDDRQFALRVGQPVRFHLLSCSADGDYQPGRVYPVDRELFHPLPPMAVALQGQEKSEIPVQLAVTQSTLGTLLIECVATDNPQRWAVEFQLRRQHPNTDQLSQLPASMDQACAQIKTVFGSKSKQVNPKTVKNLRAELEKNLGQERSQWETPVLRTLFDTLLETAKNRRRSENHERIWLNLIGFSLRPGYGYPLDEWRSEQLWKLYPSGIQYVNSAQNWSEWWTLWRRLAGGLDSAAQIVLFEDISRFLDPASARQPTIAKQLKTKSYEDIVRLAGVLERLPVELKQRSGSWLLKRLQKASEPEQTWWALGRIGARIPFYGNHDSVVPLPTATEWLEQILQVEWQKKPQAAFAATLIARASGDRVRDIDENTRRRVIDKLKQQKSPQTWIDMIEGFRELSAQETKQFFGEALPPGIKLLT